MKVLVKIKTNETEYCLWKNGIRKLSILEDGNGCAIDAEETPIIIQAPFETEWEDREQEKCEYRLYHQAKRKLCAVRQLYGAFGQCNVKECLYYKQIKSS